MYHKRRHMTPTFKFSGDLRKEKREKRQSCRVEVRIELFSVFILKGESFGTICRSEEEDYPEDTRVYLRVNGGERGHRIDIITLIWKVPSSATSSSIGAVCGDCTHSLERRIYIGFVFFLFVQVWNNKMNLLRRRSHTKTYKLQAVSIRQVRRGRWLPSWRESPRNFHRHCVDWNGWFYSLS